MVLTRKKSERLLIGEDVIVTICHIGNGAVRVGVDAPRDWLILREELRHPPALVLDLDAAQELAEGGR